MTLPPHREKSCDDVGAGNSKGGGVVRVLAAWWRVEN